MKMGSIQFLERMEKINQSNGQFGLIKIPSQNIQRVSELDALKKCNTAKLKNKFEEKKLNFQEVLLVLRYKLSAYVGLIAYDLANKKRVTRQPLSESALDVFDNVRSSKLDSVDSLLKSYDNVCRMLKSSIKINLVDDKKSPNQIYELNLPGNFLQFKARFAKAKLKASKLKMAIDTIGKKRRDKWLDMTCKLYGLSINDPEVVRIYTEAMNSDKTIDASKQFEEKIDGLTDAMVDTKSNYKYAFYTLKMFEKNRAIGISDIPNDIGITDVLPDFKSPADIKMTLTDGSIDTKFFLNESTRKDIDIKLQKVRSERSGEPFSPSKDVTSGAMSKRKRLAQRFNLSLDSNKASSNSGTRSRSRSLGAENSASSDAHTRKRTRSANIFSGVQRAFRQKKSATKFSEYVGDVLQNLYDKKPDLLNDEVKKSLQGVSSDTESIIKMLQSKKNITLFDDKNQAYEVELPNTFDDFKRVLSNAREEAKALKTKIDTTGKKKRDEWLDSVCKSHNLNMSDERVRKIYATAIAEDATITTSKRLATVIDGMNVAIKDSEGKYEHAFYTLKTLKDDKIREDVIPRGVGLGGGFISAFKMPGEIIKIKTEGSIDEQYYLNESTRNKITKEIEKIAPDRPSQQNKVDAPQRKNSGENFKFENEGKLGNNSNVASRIKQFENMEKNNKSTIKSQKDI